MLQGLAPVGQSRGICYDFLRGSCTRGDDCRFSHQVTAANHSHHHPAVAGAASYPAMQADPVLAGHAIDAGHEYIRGDNGAIEVDVELVNVMISDRVGMKLQKNFSEADQVKEALRAIGVEVFDAAKQWRAEPPQTAQQRKKVGHGSFADFAAESDSDSGSSEGEREARRKKKKRDRDRGRDRRGGRDRGGFGRRSPPRKKKSFMQVGGGVPGYSGMQVGGGVPGEGRARPRNARDRDRDRDRSRRR